MPTRGAERCCGHDSEALKAMVLEVFFSKQALSHDEGMRYSGIAPAESALHRIRDTAALRLYSLLYDSHQDYGVGV